MKWMMYSFNRRSKNLKELSLSFSLKRNIGKFVWRNRQNTGTAWSGERKRHPLRINEQVRAQRTANLSRQFWGVDVIRVVRLGLYVNNNKINKTPYMTVIVLYCCRWYYRLNWTHQDLFGTPFSNQKLSGSRLQLMQTQMAIYRWSYWIIHETSVFL